MSDLSERVHGEHKMIDDAARKLIERGMVRYSGHWLIAEPVSDETLSIEGGSMVPVLVRRNRAAVARAIAKCFANG